jgi:hypothetical protein
MEDKMTQYHGKTKDQIKQMSNGPQKKFFLLAVVVREQGSDACEQAKRMSCEDIVSRWL